MPPDRLHGNGIVAFSRRRLGRLVSLSRSKVDPFLLFLIAAVALAAFLPVSGKAAQPYAWLTNSAIALLFLSQGAKLSRQAVLQGMSHWRLHVFVLGATFLLFPIIGVTVSVAANAVLPVQLERGLLYLCLLPSTVQSSIAFTSIARGNVAAAVCSASLSNLLGVVLTPLLAAALMQTGGGIPVSWSSIGSILMLILLPFVVGHISRPLTGEFVELHRRWLGRIDRGSILLVVYGAFSGSVVARFWSSIKPFDLLFVVAFCCIILGLALLVTKAAARSGGFNRADEIAIVFCGSKKSLASGVPIAGALFPASMLGGIILPLMIFHQLQLFACSFLARRYVASFDAAPSVAQLQSSQSVAASVVQ